MRGLEVPFGDVVCTVLVARPLGPGWVLARQSLTCPGGSVLAAGHRGRLCGEHTQALTASHQEGHEAALRGPLQVAVGLHGGPHRVAVLSQRPVFSVGGQSTVGVTLVPEQPDPEGAGFTRSPATRPPCEPCPASGASTQAPTGGGVCGTEGRLHRKERRTARPAQVPGRRFLRNGFRGRSATRTLSVPPEFRHRRHSRGPGTPGTPKRPCALSSLAPAPPVPGKHRSACCASPSLPEFWTLVLRVLQVVAVPAVLPSLSLSCVPCDEGSMVRAAGCSQSGAQRSGRVRSRLSVCPPALRGERAASCGERVLTFSGQGQTVFQGGRTVAHSHRP